MSDLMITARNGLHKALGDLQKAAERIPESISTGNVGQVVDDAVVLNLASTQVEASGTLIKVDEAMKEAVLNIIA